MDPRWRQLLVRACMLGFAIYVSKAVIEKLLLFQTNDDDDDDDIDWSGLPAELLQEIATKLTDIADHARFHSVCSKWRTIPCIPPDSSQFPWLLFEPSKPTKDHYFCYHFISIFDKRVYTIRLPNRYKFSMILSGSSFGYLLIANVKLAVITLLNPFRGSQLELPPLPLPSKISMDGLMQARVVKSDDSSSGFSVIVVLDPVGVFCYRPGDDSTWSKIEIGDSYGTYCQDFAIYNKKYIFMQMNGKTPGISARIDDTDLFTESCQLVESSSGELLKVVGTTWSRMYEVYRMDRSNIQRPRWVKVTSIGEDAIFVGPWNTLCFPASDFGGVCKPNCIYFWGQRENDTFGWFDIGENKLEYLHCDWIPQGATTYGIWIRPSL